MTDSHDFPAELPADPDGGAGALGWTSGVIVLATVALAMLNAGAITSWTQELPASPAAAKVMTAADVWKARTTQLGLDAAHARFHQTWKRAQAMRWSQDERPE